MRKYSPSGDSYVVSLSKLRVLWHVLTANKVIRGTNYLLLKVRDSPISWCPSFTVSLLNLGSVPGLNNS